LIWEDWDDVSVDAIMAIFNSMEFDIQIEDYEQLLYINIIISAGEFQTLRHFCSNDMSLLLSTDRVMPEWELNKLDMKHQEWTFCKTPGEKSTQTN
jgi:hypothetical protein